MPIHRFLKPFYCFIQRHQTSLVVLGLYLLIATGLMAPMASNSVIFATGETPAHLAYIIQGRMALEEGQFPLRVAPYENNGWRYAAFQFYSQIPYTLGGLIYKFITPDNPYIAYKIMLTGSLVIGGFFIYRLSLYLTRLPVAATLAGVAYMASPYFLNTIHARGAFTELCAQGILPMVLYYVIRCYNSPQIRYFIFCAIAWFSLGITHIITFIYGSLFMGVLGLLLILNTEKGQFQMGQFLRVLGAYILGWLLGSYFLIPVAFYSQELSMRMSVNRISPYDTAWMTPLSNLLSPTSLPPLPTATGDAPTYGLHPAVGWVFLAAWGVVAYYYFSRRLPSPLSQTQAYLLPLLVVFALALLITWSPVNFWAFLPKQFWVTQFTFRFLTHIMWSGALLTGYAVTILYSQTLDRRHLVVGILLIVMAASPWLPVPRGTLTVEEVMKKPQFGFSGAMDYLNRTPQPVNYGNTQLRLLTQPWIPGTEYWYGLTEKILLSIYPNEQNWQNFPKFQEGDDPILHLDLQVPLDTFIGTPTLKVVASDQVMGSILLDKPEISWQIPFKNAPLHPAENNEFRLQYIFEGQTYENHRPKIIVKNLYFSGITPENTVIPLSQTQEICQQKGVKTLCQITVTADAQVVQLPILYYPQMQRIEVGGQRVSAFPVYHHDYSMVGLRLPPGTHNIEVIFTGIRWANWLSVIAWLGLLIGVIFLLLFPQKIDPI